MKRTLERALLLSLASLHRRAYWAMRDFAGRHAEMAREGAAHSVSSSAKPHALFCHLLRRMTAFEQADGQRRYE